MDRKVPERPFKIPKYVLSTNILWESVEQHLQEALITSSHFTDNVKASIPKNSQGSFSKIVYLDLEWYPDIPKLPKKVVIKVARATEFNKTDVDDMNKEVSISHRQLKKVVERMFKTECSFYEFFKQHERAYHAASLRIPHFYFKNDVQHGSDAYMIMKFVKDTIQMHIYDNLNDQQLDQVLRFTARLQAFGLKNHVNKVEGLKNNPFRTLYENFIRYEDLLKMYKDVASMCGEDLIEAVDNVLLKSESIFNLDIGENTNRKLMLPNILVHGNLWSANMMWDKEDTNTLRGVLDWQMAHVGCPVEDLIQLFNSCIRGESRRANWRAYLKSFYAYMEIEMKGKVPYNLERIELAYEAMYPMVTFVYVPSLVSIVRKAIQDKCLQEQDTLTAVVAEKARCMLEDIVTHHEAFRNE